MSLHSMTVMSYIICVVHRGILVTAWWHGICHTHGGHCCEAGQHRPCFNVVTPYQVVLSFMAMMLSFTAVEPGFTAMKLGIIVQW